jgi:hypothetical protein
LEKIDNAEHGGRQKIVSMRRGSKCGLGWDRGRSSYTSG